jgi:peptide/nickel transport system permease protein
MYSDVSMNSGRFPKPVWRHDSTMLKYILKRILVLIPVILGVIFFIFLITYFTPGEPGYTIIGATATDEQIAEWHAKVGLDKPFFVQLFVYIKNLFTKLDFGISFDNSRPVLEIIAERLPISMKLGIISTLIGSLIAIPLGILAAVKQNSAYDYMSTFFALIGASMPGFWLGMILVLIFSVKLGWFPTTGISALKDWVLPVITSALFPVAIIMRTTRSSVLEVIRQDYITTARSKGQTEGNIITKHTLRNAMIPVITVIGISISAAITSSLVIEVVFTIPGLGMTMAEAISMRNYPVIRGCTIVYSIIVCAINLLVDIIYTYIDPRIKNQFYDAAKKKKNIRSGEAVVS